MASFMADPRLQAEGNQMPFDGQRMIFGGFERIVNVLNLRSGPASEAGPRTIIPVRLSGNSCDCGSHCLTAVA